MLILFTADIAKFLSMQDLAMTRSKLQEVMIQSMQEKAMILFHCPRVVRM